MRKWVQTEWIWVSFILILGFLLRFYHLDFQSPWVDEIFTLKNASTDNTFKSIFELTQVQDKHPPLYYLSVHAIFEIFGEGIFIARMFSVVIGLLGILAVYFLAKEMVSKNFAWIPTLFCAVNYFHIEHSQEARMYNLLFLFAVISMLFLIKFIKKPDYKSAIWYGVSVGFFINVHFFSLFVLFAQGLILLIYILKSSNRKDGLKLFKLSALAYSLSLIMYIPSIMVLLHVSETKEFWIKKPEWDIFIYMVNVFFGKSEILLTLIGFISLLSIYYLIKYKKNFQINGVPLGVILI